MGIIRLCLLLLCVAIIVDGIIHFFRPDLRNQYKWAKILKNWTDVLLNPLRKLMGKMPYDFSYLVFIGIVAIIVALW